MTHLHGVFDSDTSFSINAITRQIKSDPRHKTTLMQNDHNSERFSFELPRYIEGHDMSICNQVEIHYLNSSYSDKKEFRKGLYMVDDLQISPDDTEKVICSWLISQNATQLVGKLSFRLRFKCVENGVITYAWHTAIFADISISDGINSDETFEMEYVDIIEQWKEAVRIEFSQWQEKAVDEMSNEITAWKELESGKVRGEMTSFSAQWNDALNVERKRIDNLVALPEGSTAGDAELQDIRVGADGVTYESAGTAVREQFRMEDKKLSVLGDFEADTSDWKPINVLSGYSWGEPGYTFDDYGNLVSTEYTKQFTPLTELVHAIPGASYQASGFVGQIRIYTADKKQLDLIYNHAMVNQLSFTAPEEAGYFGIYYRHDIINTEERIAAIKLFRTTMTAEEYRACPMVLINGRIPGNAIADKSIGKNKIADDIAMFISPLYGKTIVNFGDSIFGNARPPEDISTHIAALTGATVYNCGFGGCRMSYHPSANYDAFSMTKLADAVANNDFSVQEAAILNTEGDSVPGYFAESVELLKSIDFSNVDIVTITYGANDFNGVGLENADNSLDQRTFAGALRYSIETILAAYPHIRIFVCSPTYRFWMDSDYSFVEDSDTKNGGASYLTTDIAKKAKEVAVEYKLPYIDNYYSLGINKFNRAQYFPKTDGAHHNINGRKLIAAHIAKELF